MVWTGIPASPSCIQILGVVVVVFDVVVVVVDDGVAVTGVGVAAFATSCRHCNCDSKNCVCIRWTKGQVNLVHRVLGLE